MSPERSGQFFNWNWFYYFFFPLIIVFRMARILYILIYNSMRTSTFPYQQQITDWTISFFIDLCSWYGWWFGLFVIVGWKGFISLLIPFRPLIMLFLLIYGNPDDGIRLNSSRMQDSTGFDERLLLLSHYRIYASWVYLLTLSRALIFSSLHVMQSALTKCLLLPTNWISERLSPWPPDGVPLAILMGFFAFLTYLYIVGKGFRYMISIKMKES